MSSSSSYTDKWAEAHANPQGPGDARPTALDIIKEEGLEGKWGDKVVLITGASSGIGVETARALHRTGAHLFLAVRDVNKGEAVVSDIQSTSGGSGGELTVLKLDLNSLASVKECVADFLTQSNRLHVLINNAGVMATPEGKTADGFETQFGTNHVAHFLLFQLLKPTLLSSSTPHFNSRVVCLSSATHGRSPILFGDYDQSKRDGGYDTWVAYGQSKTANIYLATEIERRYGSLGLHGLAVHPGTIVTGLLVHVEQQMAEVLKDAEAQKQVKSVEQGAATTVWAATARVWEGKGGKFLEDCGVAQPKTPETGLWNGYAPHAYDEVAAKRLWDETLKMVGLDDDEHRDR